jgi:peptidoglycan/LPS O-acetylase OafA/YrhL
MFFIISGFLIVFLLLEEKARTSTISLSKFYVRRALRILPLYFLVVAVAYFQFHATNSEINFQKFCYFGGNFWLIEHNDWSVSILNPLWSICIEEHFYLIIPVLLLFFPLKKVHFLFFGILFFSFFYKFYITQTIPNGWMALYCHTFSRCDALAIGGLLAYFYKQNRLNISIGQLQFWAISVYLFLMMAMIDSGDFSTVIKAIFIKTLFILPLTLIFVAIVLNQKADDGLVLWLKNNQILNYLGKISFGIYMFHSPIGTFLSQNPFLSTHSILRVLTIVVATILLATISYEFFEKKILKLKTRFEVVKTINKL